MSHHPESNSTPVLTDDHRLEPFASALLAEAAQIECAEQAIKSAIVAAAQAGDCGRVAEIMQRWQSVPSIEVLKSEEATLPPTSRLD